VASGVGRPEFRLALPSSRASASVGRYGRHLAGHQPVSDFARLTRALMHRLGWYLMGLPVDDQNPYRGWRWARYQLGRWLCHMSRRR
jgi:hypothetical protein